MAQAQSEYLIEIKLIDGKAQATLNGVSVSLRDVDKQLKNIKSNSTGASSGIANVGKAAKGTTKANQDLISSSGLAGATLVETGRFISDLPFGITAVTNNLSQLSTLFVTLISKTEGAGKAFKLLGKQLMGPLGFILAFQVVIALIQAYQKEILGFINGTNKANKATQELTKSIDDLRDKLAENNPELKEEQEEFQKLIDKLIDMRQSITLAQGSIDRDGTFYKSMLSLKKLIEDTYGVVIDFTDPSNFKKLKEAQGPLDLIARKLVDLQTAIDVAAIKGTKTPAELAQMRLDLFIETQKQQKVAEETYIKEPEYAKLVAKVERAKMDARRKAINENFKERGEQVDEEIEIERALLRRRIVEERLDPVQVAEENLRIYKQMQKALGKKEKDYIESPEYLDLQTEIAKAQIEARKQAVQNVLKRDGLKGLGVLFTPEETALMKEARGELNKGAKDRDADFRSFFGDPKTVTSSVENIDKFKESIEEISAGFDLLNEAGNALFEAEISREERKTASINNSLRSRLKNEKLSAKERERINNQISANEEALARKRDKIAEKQFKINKAVSIATALMNTYLAATDVLAREKLGVIGKIVAMTAVISAGLLQVAAIARQQFVPSAIGAGGGGGAGASSVQAPDFNVVGASAQSQLAETIAGAEAKPTRAYVVGKDITTQQELDRNITNTASFG